MNEELLSPNAVNEEVPLQPIEDTEPEEHPLLTQIASLRAELSELREELNKRQKAEEINRRNAERSAGRAGTSTAPEYYSPDEVRAMSAHEVRENYQKIRAPMKRWR